MNIQEAIDMIDTMGPYSRFQDEPLPKTTVINIINQIDEPKKVVIPKFVAEWFAKNPINGWWRKIAQWEQVVPLEDKEVYEWYSNFNETKFMQAWIAYPNVEVEKEKLYIIPLKGLITTDGHQQYLTGKVGRYFASRRNYHLKQTFTQTELDNNVPACYREWAEPVEVE